MYGKGKMILEKIEFQVKDAFMKEHKLLKLEKHANFAQYFKMHNILQKHFAEIYTPIKVENFPRDANHRRNWGNN